MLKKKKILLLVLLLIIAAFALTAAMTVYRQNSHFRQAEGYAAAQNWKLAIREYDTAIHFHVPFSPIAGKAAQKLWQIGLMFEARGKTDWALIAYSSIRSGFYGTRSFYTPGKDWIEKCDGKIAALDTAMLIKEGGIKPRQAARQRQKYLALFRDNRAPSVFWSVLAETGFLGWSGAALATAFLGFTREGKPKGKPAFYGVICFLVFAAIWVVSLLKA